MITLVGDVQTGLFRNTFLTLVNFVQYLWNFKKNAVFKQNIDKCKCSAWPLLNIGFQSETTAENTKQVSLL